MEEEIVRLLAQADLALQTRNDFIAIAAHELKTPLTSILGYATLLYDRALPDLKDEDIALLSIVIAQAGKLNMMITTLLDISRIQQGRLSIQPFHSDLATLIREVVLQLQITTDHTLSMVIPDHLICLIDSPRIEQVVRNVLTNAIKYTRDEGVVSISLDRVGDEAILVVADHGIGIPAADLPHVFELFYRADNLGASVNTQISGLGLGLFVSHEIVALHHGSIILLSDGPHQGTTCIVRLPL